MMEMQQIVHGLFVKSNRPLLQNGFNQINHLTVLMFAFAFLIIPFNRANSKYLDYDDITPKALPKCQDHRSICGYMQVNSVGLNKVPICSCNNNDCRLWWNIFDDRIIKHGNDFYKFCGKKPELLPCRNNEIAYVSYGKTDLKTGEKLTEIQEIKCLCPNDYILKTNKTMFEMTDTFYIYGTEQICQKPLRCTLKQFCLSITESAEATIERRHCRCPPGKYCPKDVRLAHEEVKEDSGILYNMRCI